MNTMNSNKASKTYGYPGTWYIGKDGKHHKCRTINGQPCVKHAGAGAHITDEYGNPIIANTEEELEAKLHANNMHSFGISTVTKDKTSMKTVVNSNNDADNSSSAGSSDSKTTNRIKTHQRLPHRKRTDSDLHIPFTRKTLIHANDNVNIPLYAYDANDDYGYDDTARVKHIASIIYPDSNNKTKSIAVNDDYKSDNSDNMTPDELEGVRQYTGYGSNDMNQILRGTDPGNISNHSPDEVNMLLHNLNSLTSAINNSEPVHDDMIVYRNSNHLIDLNEIDKDGCYVKKDFTSTSYDNNVSSNFGVYNYVIHVAPGTRGVNVGGTGFHDDERELILQQGQRFKVKAIVNIRNTSRINADSKPVIILETIPGDNDIQTVNEHYYNDDDMMSMFTSGDVNNDGIFDDVDLDDFDPDNPDIDLNDIDWDNLDY